MVHTDADGRVVGLADVEERHETGFYLLQFLRVFLVGVLQLDEASGGINVVAGVDTHLLCVPRRHVGHVRIEVDVGHKGRAEAVGTDAGIDVFEVLGLANALRGEAHELASGLDNALRLGHTGLRVVGIGGGHRLDSHRVAAAHAERAHVHFGGFAPSIVEQVYHMLCV